MKNIRTIISILIVVTFLAVMFPVYANAAPLMDTIVSLNSFNGKWVSTRAGSLQTLKIKCDADTGYCKMEAVAEYSGSCTNQFGEPTGRLWEGEEQVQVIDQAIQIPVDSYCLTEPPTYDKKYTFIFTYNSATDTLTDNIGATWYRVVKPFEGKWVSTREGSPQTLKLRCDVETGYCKMDMITEISASCTNLAGGVPTGRYFEGEGMVEVINQSIKIPAISYCMTKPPSDFHYDDPPISFTYHPANDTVDDTLTDSWGVTWERK